jgi:hypothetical protein
VVETYRSYVIRIRRRHDLPDAVRLDVEDLLGGGRAAINGEEARSLADRLTEMVADGERRQADTAQRALPPQARSLPTRRRA